MGNKYVKRTEFMQHIGLNYGTNREFISDSGKINKRRADFFKWIDIFNFHNSDLLMYEEDEEYYDERIRMEIRRRSLDEKCLFNYRLGGGYIDPTEIEYSLFDGIDNLEYDVITDKAVWNLFEENVFDIIITINKGW